MNFLTHMFSLESFAAELSEQNYNYFIRQHSLAGRYNGAVDRQIKITFLSP